MKRLTQTLFKTFTTTAFNPLKFKTGQNVQKLTVGLGISAYALYFSTQKIFNSENRTFETEDNLQEGEVRELKVGPKDEDTVLVICYKGDIYCTQSKCAHYGFNLAKGLLIGDKLICPLHNAAFSIKSGHEEQGPVFNGLKTFPVKRENGKIIVSIPADGWDQSPAPRTSAIKEFNPNKKIVIVGGGIAGLAAVDSLRQTGYDGVIYMVSKEAYLPYDRTTLSKGSGDPEKHTGPIRDAKWFNDNGVTFYSETTVNEIDYQNKQVKTDKQNLSYDKLLIASGCQNRYPPIDGLDKVKHLSLRNISDYKAINSAVREQGAKNVTIIGAGFIGIELASALKTALKDQVNVTILEAANVPLQRVLGQQVGKVWQNLSEKNGVKIHTSAKINKVSADQNGQAKSVTVDGQELPTDVLIMATGVKPALDYVGKDLIDQDNMGVRTNVFLETAQKDVFAAGDVASYPYWYNGNRTRIEHFNEAIYQGSVAGMNMAGKKFPMDNVPFFWTRQFNNSLVFTGVTHGWDEVHVTGNPEEMKFVAYYIDKARDRVLGAAAMGMLNKVQIINEAMKNGVMPSASTVKDPNFNLEKLLGDIINKNPACSRCSHL